MRLRPPLRGTRSTRPPPELVQLRDIGGHRSVSEEALDLMVRSAEAGVVSQLDQALAGARAIGVPLFTTTP
ncbi:hypothetical protein AT728_16160 [Streptomyces silvensis]|uniref:Uncharacterized protein n=1 Tax=Streptomyces silvensis TaxID=1765722 RepID=A0A0W7X396_9ACTN|nr:hypothetical protein AT728_16160 [Streptomyces silvensis]